MKIHFAYIAIILCFISCQKQIIDKAESIPIERTSDETKAINTLHEFIRGIKRHDVKSSQPTDIEIISISKSELTKSHTSSGLFEIKFKHSHSAESSNGFAIVGEDANISQVFAYVPHGDLADTSYNKGLSYFVRQLKRSITKESSITKDAGESWIGRIFYEAQYDSAQVVRELSLSEAIHYGPMSPFVIDSTVTYDVASYRVATSWGQKAPYNNKVPTLLDTITNTFVKPAIGCAAIAIGQLTSYHFIPDSLNWNLILESPHIQESETEKSDIISDFLYSIAQSASVKYNITYDEYGNPIGYGATNPSKIIPALNALGYTGTITTYGRYGNADIPIWYILRHDDAPVLFSATTGPSSGGHIWLIDEGVRQRRMYADVITENMSDGSSKYYLRIFPVAGYLVHCNWGFNGVDNGYYYNFIMDSIDYNYSYNKVLYHNIKPM